MASWWQDPITQAFNPPVEPGEDIGTPFHTPVTALAPGRVQSVSTGGYGARVDIALGSGGGIVEYYQHLDQVAPGLNVGSQVTAGQLLGLSGGQLSGGNLPNSPYNSTGPHIEVGLFGPAGQAIDPRVAIAGGPQAAPGIGSGALSGNPGDWLLGIVTGLQNAAGLPGAAGTVGALGAGAITQSQPGYVAAGQYAGGVVTSAKKWLQSNIIPLVIAALIILVVLGTGQKTVQQPAPQVVPVPV